MLVFVSRVVGKFSSLQIKCDVAPELITNFRLFFFVVADLCLPPGLFLGFFLLLFLRFCGLNPVVALLLCLLFLLVGSNSFWLLGECGSLFYQSLFLVAKSLFLLRTPRFPRCFWWASNWMGGRPHLSQVPNILLLSCMGASFRQCLQTGASLYF